MLVSMLNDVRGKLRAETRDVHEQLFARRIDLDPYLIHAIADRIVLTFGRPAPRRQPKA